MKIFKKKPIIISIVLLTLFFIICICSIMINSNQKKSNSANTFVSEKSKKARKDKSKKILETKNNKEDINVETDEVTNKDKEKEDEKKEESNDASDNTNSKKINTSSDNNNSNNNATNNSSNNQSSNSISNYHQSVSDNTDEQDWNNFINDYNTLLILGGNIDFYSQSEQIAESNKWVNLGYRTELPTVCTYLSKGQRCVYSLFVFAGEGTCGTSNSISVNWRNRNYISDIDYLKSLGYNCP